MRQKARQQSAVPYTIPTQEPNNHGKKVQQHKKGGTRHISWPTKFHQFCFAHDISIRDHKALVAIFKKDVAPLSQGL